MTDTKKELEQALSDIKKANSDAREFLDGVDKKIAELDLKYAKMLVQDDINTLKVAKKIVEAE